MIPSEAIGGILRTSDWYGRRAHINRLTYLSLKTIQLILTTTIPILSLIDSGRYSRVVIALIGASVAIIEGFLQLQQTQANWLRYRATRESLKREALLHSASAGPYADVSNADSLFIERADAIISGELSKWISAQGTSTKPRDDSSQAGGEQP
jgi:hypothetical protein